MQTRLESFTYSPDSFADIRSAPDQRATDPSATDLSSGTESVIVLDSYHGMGESPVNPFDQTLAGASAATAIGQPYSNGTTDYPTCGDLVIALVSPEQS
ncbi:MAG: hypothetical protein QOE51_1594 [Actinoplanes sp.]|nr:hypothetical protein [Actinoplanes sp.]